MLSLNVYIFNLRYSSPRIQLLSAIPAPNNWPRNTTVGVTYLRVFLGFLFNNPFTHLTESLGDLFQTGSFGEKLTDRSVCVLIQSMLTGEVWKGKIQNSSYIL